jgi:amino acid adenylation domain-containing protein
MKFKNVEDIYPLSPTQQGILFHNFYDPRSAMYFEIITWVIKGSVNVRAFEQAWQSVVDRHTTLRTFFAWEGLDEPLQVVRKRVRLPLQTEDWRGLDPDSQAERLDQFFARERERGFDLTSAPLMRVSLIRTAEETYRFVWSYHHVLVDGWSVPVILKDVFDFYEALDQGHECRLTPSRPFRDYIVWLRQQDLSQAEAFWRRSLQGFTAATPLNFGNGPAAATQVYREEQIHLSRETSNALRAIARQHQLTLNTIFQGAWAILLSRYCGARDVVFGVAVSGRPPQLPEVESIVGMLVNTLPARVSVKPTTTILPWLKSIQEHQVEMRNYEYTPLVKIQGWSDVPRGTQLFESIVAFENHPIDGSLATASRSGAELTDIVHYHTATGYPLNLMIDPGAELLIKIMFDGGRFEAPHIRQMLRHFEQVLEGMVARPEGKVGELELLSEEERQRMQEWNETEREYGRERSIAAVFEEQVRERPEAVAVVLGERSLTYGELNRRANQLGHYLREQGVGPEVCVGLCVERSLEMVVGLLGVLKAGGAYVPLDAGYPTERLAYMLADAGVAVVLTQESLLEVLPLHWGQVVSLDGEWEQIGEQSEENLASGVAGENLAYVMYTSGSTGEPKGVGIVQRAVVRLVKETNYAEFGAGEVFVQLAPLTFDASTFEVWGSLLNGGRLVLLEPGAPTLEELGAALRQYGVSTLWLTAGLFHLLVDERPEELRGLRQLLAGGDVLSAGHVGKALQWLEGGCVINGYGPTENTTFSCCQRLSEVAEVGAVVPIGRPIANTQAYVLNRELRQVAVGVVGELYLGGDGLARGYQQRPELTGERFIPHPYSGAGGARLYRTGDLVRYLEDGRLEFVGRVDDQVKVRGFRIEPGEIETVLGKHSSVRQCVVLARQEIGIDKQLVAYVLLEERQSITGDDLRGYLRKHLPDYMIPSQIVFLDAFPLTANGKVDRSALPSPFEAGDMTSQDFVAPDTPAEIALAEAWKRVLGVDRVSVHDNFFDLGGDSIRSIQVRAQAQKAGYEFSVQQIFEHQTIAELALVAKSVDGRVRQPFNVAPFGLITPADRARIPTEVEDAYPLSRLQAGMLFHSELSPHAALYHDIIGFHVRTPLDRSALGSALQQATERHPVLRTSFDRQHYSEPLQLVHRTVQAQVSFTDLQHLSIAERKQFLARWIEEEKRRRFDWTQPPFIHFSIFIYGNEDFHINFSFHHAILDGWSLSTLLTEVFSIYLSFRGVQRLTQIQQAPLSTVFRDLIALELQSLQSEECRDYWSEKLRELPVTTLPAREGAAPPAAKREVMELSFDSELVEGLRSFAKLARVPLKSVLLAAHMKILGLWSGQAVVTTGLVSNCRPEEPGGDVVLGLFLNTLPFTLPVGDQMWLELAQAAAEAEQDMSPYRRYPLAELQRAHGTQPLFETTFNFTHLHILQNLQDAPNLEIVETNSFTRTNFPLSVGFDFNSMMSKLVLFLEYDPARFSHDQIESIGNYFSRALHAMARDPFAASEPTCLLTESERQHLLLDLNDTSEDYSREVCLQELIEDQAARTPDAIALISDDGRLSYGELNRRANRLAHYLRAQGVGPESLVGVLMERSNDLVAALLGVLKAGGAYVPLDPAYPRDRLRFMLEDAGVGVLLTERNLRNHLLSHQALVVSVDDEATETALNSAPSHNPERVGCAENLVYLLYTSGSTGVPKGVLVTHRGIVNCVAWMQRTYGLSSSDRFLFKTSLNFDASVWEVFWPLTIGAAVVVARPLGQHDAAYLVETMRTEDVTCVYFVPSMLALWLETSGIGALPVLRYVICGGEALSGQLLAHYYERLGEGVELHHSYGPTETSIASAESVCALFYSTWRQMPLGRALANTRLYVVDAGLRLVPMGIAGELCIGGDGVARGYLNRPEVTATAFIPDPFSTEAGARLYRTGDLVRYLHDGQLEFLGRVDDQVKLRGVRIELGEIEATLRSHPAVREAVAVVHEFTVGDRRLVVYAVAEPGGDSAKLREYLRGKLPEHLLPSALVLLEKLPLLPNGKVNKNALPAPELTREEAVAHAYVAPRTAVEEAVAGIWSELLGVERAGVYDNFFELGGHSLLAAQIMVRVRDKFAVEVPLRSLFDAPNVAGLALAVMQSQSEMLAGEAENMLAELEALSEEEAESLVAGHGAQS